MAKQSTPATRKRPAATKGKPAAMPEDFWEEVVAGERCGAKLKKGKEGFCRRRPYLAKAHQDGPGPWRCKLHGGVSANAGPPKKNQNARSHGIYSRALSDDEKALWDEMAVRDVDGEILMTKIRLKRAFEAEYAQERALAKDSETDHGMHTTERKVVTSPSEDGGVVTERTIIRKRYDFAHIIDRLVNQLTRLIQQKVNMEGDGAPDVDDIAVKVRAAIGDVRGNPEKMRGFVHMPLDALGVRNAANN